jgi:hypothetical protein
MPKTTKLDEYRKWMTIHIPTATSALTSGLPSETTLKRLLTIALIFSSSSHSSSPPTPAPSLHESPPMSSRVPSAKTAQART